jgi:hypothetical protein
MKSRKACEEQQNNGVESQIHAGPSIHGPWTEALLLKPKLAKTTKRDTVGEGLLLLAETVLV